MIVEIETKINFFQDQKPPTKSFKSKTYCMLNEKEEYGLHRKNWIQHLSCEIFFDDAVTVIINLNSEIKISDCV